MSIPSNIGVPIIDVNRNSDASLYHNGGMSVGNRLREARKEAGLTQAELGTKVGMTQVSISDLENGKSAGTTNIATLAAVLGVSPLWLQEGRGPKKPEPGRPPYTGNELSSTDLAELIVRFNKCNPEWKKKVLDLAGIGAAESGNPTDDHQK
jgi:transcriptional regulator with XRE-family HTH domain